MICYTTHRKEIITMQASKFVSTSIVIGKGQRLSPCTALRIYHKKGYVNKPENINSLNHYTSILLKVS
jgi:hypothetical protein